MNSTAVEAISAWEGLDSRGKPTVGCEVRLAGGARGQAYVPSGASTGRHEARELRDGDDRYEGQGVQRAAANAATIMADAVHGLDALDMAAVDAALRAADGTADLGRLGANAVLAMSVATALAAADSQRMPLYRLVAENGDEPLLPLPMVNIISGGAHAGRSIDVQDFLAVPIGARSLSEAIEYCARVRRGTAEVLTGQGHSVALVADEGGLGPVLPTNRAALDMLVAGIERAGLQPGAEVAIAVDVAATQFLGQDGHYVLTAEGNRRLTASELVEELVQWCEQYPIISIEDALGEDDWDGWVAATERLGTRQLLGDDFFVTDAERLRRGIAAHAANAVLVKPNQTGTLSDAHTVVRLAQDNGFRTVLSARSGETEDAWLADLALGWRTGQIKVGSTMRSERTAKWNRLLQIESQLGTRIEYAGASAISTPSNHRALA